MADRCTWDRAWPTGFGDYCGKEAAWENLVEGEFDPLTREPAKMIKHLPCLLCDEHYWHRDVKDSDRRRLKHIEKKETGAR
jgi:hypothetical protein